MNWLVKLIISFSLVGLIPFSQAADLAGRVIMVRGEAQAVGTSGETRQLQRRDEVYASDIISTGDNSRVQIRFVDKGLLALRANSKLNIKTYRQPQDASDEGEVLMELVEGGFRTLTGTIGKGNKAAYKVDTPVASIGIRGTLYSVLLQKSQLLAGVWKGGISLNSPQGSFDLGMGSDFDFAQLGNQGFQGLLNPPEALVPPAPPAPAEQQDSEGDNGLATEISNDQAPQPQSSGSDPTLKPAALPNPLDKEENSTNEDALKKQVVTHTPTDKPDSDTPDSGNNPDGDNTNSLLKSPDARMTDKEYDSFLKTKEYGAFITANSITVGSAFNNDDDKTVFVSVRDGSNSAINVTEFSANSSQVATPIANVTWGIWNGTAEQPIKQYIDSKSLTHTDLSEKAIWIRSTPIRIADLHGLSGNMTFKGNGAAPGFDSRGVELTNVSGELTLNLTTGDISDGSLTANYNGDIWMANFDGNIRPDNITENTPILDLDVTGGSHGEISLDMSGSNIGGILTAPATSGGAPGVAGGFQLKDAAENTATGLIAWPTVVSQP